MLRGRMAFPVGPSYVGERSLFGLGARVRNDLTSFPIPEHSTLFGTEFTDDGRGRAAEQFELE